MFVLGLNRKILLHRFIYYKVNEIQDQRFGQYICNNYLKPEYSCPEVFYEKDDYEAFSLILDLLEPENMNRLRTEPNPDDSTNPTHYAIVGDYEAIDVIRASLTPEEFAGFCKGNSLKYLMRANKKNGEEDLQKAEWYLAELHSDTDEV